MVNLSLRAACRYELTKAKSHSYLLLVAGFAFGMNAMDYGRRMFIPALASYAQMQHFHHLGLFSPDDVEENSVVLKAISEKEFRKIWESIRSLPLSSMVRSRQNLLHRIHSSLRVPLDPALWNFVAYGQHHF